MKELFWSLIVVVRSIFKFCIVNSWMPEQSMCIQKRWNFLSYMVVRLCVEIHNKVLLFGSFAFMTAALTKFPAIFNIKEEKKGFFHLHSTIQNFGFIVDLCHTAIITSLILFYLLKELNFLSGITSKYDTRQFLISMKKWTCIVTAMSTCCEKEWKSCVNNS